MAEQALEIELRQETEFLAAFDRITRAVNEEFDLRGSDLATLVRCCLDNGGILSKKRRKQFTGRVPEKVFDFLEGLAKAVQEDAAGEQDSEEEGDPSAPGL